MTRTKPFRFREVDEKEDLVPKFELLELTDDDGNDGQDFIREESGTDCVVLPTLPPGGHYVATLQALGTILAPGTVVELRDGDFLQIKYIFKTSAFSASQLRGILFRRSRRVSDMLPKKINEVCMICKVEEGVDIDLQPDSFLVERGIVQVVGVRDLNCTNRPFPALSWRESGRTYVSTQEIEETAVLVCRWRYTMHHAGSTPRGKVAIKEESLARLREHACDRGHGIPEAVLRQTTHMSPAKTKDKAKQRSTDEIDLTEECEETITTTVTKEYRRSGPDGIFTKRTRQDSTISERYLPKVEPNSGVRKHGSTERTHKQSRDSTKASVKRYTSGDIGSGGCGMASGAAQAGLNIKFLLDHSEDECNTARLNFPGTKVLHMSIHDFCNADHKTFYGVDIVHVSFPCQPHSPAHTQPGKNDEANIASGYSIRPLLEQCQPRGVTIEQTSGMITHNGAVHFRALIHQLTDVGYSARWRIVNCAEYGNVQPRKRLIILAAAPGETLPPFPDSTHGFSHALKPPTTIYDCLKRLPRSRDIAPIMQSSTARDGDSYNPRQQLGQAITTDGGAGNLDPSGKRTFTLQELALLQGFLPTHKFAGGITAIKRQIGNAVPGCVAKTIFEAVIESLKETDGLLKGSSDRQMKMEPMDSDEDEQELPAVGILPRRRGTSFQTAIALQDDDDEVMEVPKLEVKRKTKTGGLRQAPIKLEDADIIQID
ncbi:hypothetical protein LTR86_003272 [Recurvomyces mirabilis]|nr:hypothetical protein LTR86_003272 [Recurvomyces mirabilis]